MWLKEWPTEPGYYWAYGYLSQVPKPKMAFVYVSVSGVCYWGNCTLHPTNCKDVHWMRVVPPDPPIDLVTIRPDEEPLSKSGAG